MMEAVDTSETTIKFLPDAEQHPLKTAIHILVAVRT
jgi:hypothetical protein